MIGGRLGRPNRLTPARARATVDALADAGDVAGLRRLALALPALVAFTYERRRAAAFALALEGKVEGALSELALGRAGLWTSSERTAEDAAAVRRLAGGDPAGRPPRLDLRATLGVAAVAATVVIAVGVTVRLAAVEAPLVEGPLSVIEAPPERADTFVRTPRLPPTATPSPARERAPADAAAPNPARVLRTRAELRGADARRGSRPIPATPRSSKARPAAPTAPAAPEPEPPAPIEPPAAPTPTAAPAAPSTPAADPTPAAAPAPAPPPPNGQKNGRRRSHEKQPRSERPKKHEQPEQHEQSAPAVPEAAPAAAAPPEPAPSEPQQPASDPGHGPPPHASNDREENEDKGPKEKPEKEKR